MTDSAIITQKRKELKDLHNFNRFLHMKNRREPVEIKIEFQNGRFKTGAGFAFIEGPSMSMRAIVAAMARETEEQIVRLSTEIEDYE
jgi:hypothetical protein